MPAPPRWQGRQPLRVQPCPPEVQPQCSGTLPHRAHKYFHVVWFYLGNSHLAHKMFYGVLLAGTGPYWFARAELLIF